MSLLSLIEKQTHLITIVPYVPRSNLNECPLHENWCKFDLRTCRTFDSIDSRPVGLETVVPDGGTEVTAFVPDGCWIDIVYSFD